MNGRERFFAALEAKPVDRIPVSFSANAVVNAAWGISQTQALAMSAQERADVFVRGHREFGSDVIHAGFNGTMSIRAVGGAVSLSERHAPSLDEALVNSIDDISRIKVEALKEDVFYRQTLDVCLEIVRQNANQSALSVGSYGPFTLAGLLMGPDRFMRAVLKDKPFVGALLELTHRLYMANVEDFLSGGADIAFVAEPTASGDMVSRRVFREFAAPAIARVSDEVHAMGKAVCLHICGDITDRLPDIPSTKCDVISLDYKVTMGDARRALGDTFPIAGNADPVAVMADGTPSDVIAAFETCKREAGQTAYMIMPGCTLPSRTPRANIDAMNGCAEIS